MYRWPLALAALSASCLAALTAGPASASALPSVINASLSSVSCTAPNNYMAVGWFLGQIPGTSGFQNFTLAEQWDGTGWRVQPSPNPRGAAVAGFSGISCPGTAACMAVGSSTDPTGESAFNLAEAWNGTNWSLVKTPHP